MKYNDSWFGLLSQSALKGLSEYYKKSESLLESDKKSDLSRIEEKVQELGRDKKLTEDEKYGEWNLLMNDHDTTYEMFFTNLFRYSCVVLVNLVLEDHLHKLCWALFKVKKHPESPKGDGINACKRYIQRFHLSYDQSVWDFIDDLRRIRNCIVHSSGDVSRRNPKQQSELRVIAKKNIGIHIGRESRQYHLTPLYLDDDMIIIEPRYCESIIHGVIVLFETLCKAANLPLEIEFELSNN